MARSGNERAFKNPFEDFKGQTYLEKDGKLSSKYQEPLLQALAKLQGLLAQKVKDDGRDDSVYTGAPGQALLELQLYLRLPPRDSTHLLRAAGWLRPWLQAPRSREVSFLCGAAGPLAIAAVVAHYLGDGKACKDYVAQLEGLAPSAESGDFPDELLYGRCGYLASLMFVQKHLGAAAVNSRCIVQVVKKVLASGQQTSKAHRLPFPLMYTWLGEPYLGGAHGLAGIYYVLLQVQEPSLVPRVRELVRPCLDFLLTQRHPSGNGFPCLGESGHDRLVHWCHGAPGWVQLYCLAHQIYGEPTYLAAAEACGRVVWQRGLLHKGYGLCHGAAGNGYTFTALHRLTGDPRWLHRALMFGQWCCEFGSHGCRTPDRPWSLFEGLAGCGYYLADLLQPATAAFPAYDLL